MKLIRAVNMNFRTFILVASLEIVGNLVLVVRRYQQIAREIDLDSKALADRERRQNIQKAVEDAERALRETRRESLAVGVRGGLADPV